MVAIIYIHRSVLEFIDRFVVVNWAAANRERQARGQEEEERGTMEYLLLGQDVTCSALSKWHWVLGAVGFKHFSMSKNVNVVY